MDSIPPTAATLTRRDKLFIATLVVAGVVALLWTAYAIIVPPAAPPNIAAQAQRLLRSQKVMPLSASLSELLADPKLVTVSTQEHPLLGRAAPDFQLADPNGRTYALKHLVARGPVVLVFYYGYTCDHCVAQLFGLQEDLAHFRELGAEVVAISADPPEQTREKFREYGAFTFPVLSDQRSYVAEKYGAFTPTDADRTDGKLLHGTFVIDRDGVVRWANLGLDPFFHNPTLLFELARIEKRLPTSATAP